MRLSKDFFKKPLGLKVEKYLWEVAVLSLGLTVSIVTELDAGYLIIVVPLVNQITKWINVNHLK